MSPFVQPAKAAVVTENCLSLNEVPATFFTLSEKSAIGVEVKEIGMQCTSYGEG